MNNKSYVLIILAAVIVAVMPGCAFLAGTGAGAAYEVNARRQLDKLEEDYKAGKITKQEYEARKEQIKKGSLVY